MVNASFECRIPQFRSGGERLLLYEAGLCPLSAGSSYRRKRPPPQFPRSILSMKSLKGKLLGETLTETSHPGQAKSTICMSYFMTGDPDKERGTNKPPPTGRIGERSKGERRHQSTCPTSLPESSWLSSWAHHQKGPWVRMLGQRQPEK